MTHHEDAGFGEAGGELHDAGSPLELHRVRAGFLEEAARVAQSVFSRALVAHKGHVAYDQGVCCPPHHGCGVMHHLVNGDRKCVLVTQHHHAERVADEKNRDAGFIQEPSRESVVRGEHHELLAAIFVGADIAHGYGHCRLLSRVAAAPAAYAGTQALQLGLANRPR